MTNRDIKRFWKRIDKARGAPCWLWTGACSSFGHGHIKIAGKLVGTHRVSWLIHKGDIPNGLCVLHKCDVPACTRPSHLFLGTKADNIRDMEAKGRRIPISGERHRVRLHPELVRGESNGRARLNAAQVIEIRAKSDKTTIAEIAREYGMSEGAIRHIVKRRHWSHIKEVAEG